MGARPGSRSIVKVAYAVPDSRAAAAQWAERYGAGPFFVKSHIPLAEFPEPGFVFDHTSAFGRWGNVMVELLQIHEVRPAAVERVLVSPGFHHVTWFADSVAAETDRLVRMGWPEVLTASTATGTRFTFHDARADLGHLVLIYERTPGVVKNYATVEQAARNWDGQDPVRET